MAKIVLGLGSSHSPQLSAPPEAWPEFGKNDKNNPELLGRDGRYHPYDEFLAQADPALSKQLFPSVWQAKWERCQKGIAWIGERLAEVSPDVLIIVGDDQEELFHEDNAPALLVYWGDEVINTPRVYPERVPEAVKAAGWGYGVKSETFPGAPDLGRHLIETLVDHEVDVSHSRLLKPTRGVGHAFGFVYHRLFNSATPIPTLPIMLNTYYPPNQPTPKRCYEIGQAICDAVESWDSDARVAILGSGGLSHFVIDERLDQEMIEAMQAGDGERLTSVPRELLNSGTSESRNWIAAAGALTGLRMHLHDYIPCYRSPAGTGCAMAFAEWS
ncbi:MAG TPA: extradiol ring-cleavage dioxygenase [Dehalococcoidia bacterium]|nr:extradiol ring-cleavage dioxygenase [Dehalococcoidia bacterium]